MVKKVRVIYDFQAEAETELSVGISEELIVIDDQTYEGWYMVRNRGGREGIVPAAYVEYMEDTSYAAPPPPPPPTLPASQSFGWNTTLPPPPPPQQQQSYSSNQQKNISFKFNDYNSYNSNNYNTNNTTTSNYNALNNLDLDQLDSFFGSSNNNNNNNNSISNNNNNRSFQANEGNANTPVAYTADSFFSTFDDLSPSVTAATTTTLNNAVASSNSNNENSNKNLDDDSDFDDEPVSQKNYSSPSTHTINHSNTEDSDTSRFNTLRTNSISGTSSGTGTLKHKPKNSFGLEAYLYVGPIKPIKESEKVSTIILDENGQAQWQRRSPPYTIKITNTLNENKYKGLKTYTAYTIQSNIFSHSVNRRYKQFDWLHERFSDKFPNLLIPPLPDKAVTGRFEEEFIKKRQTQLELWLNRMSLHPVVNQSEVFIHFLQCKDGETNKWKDGKRKHEKDEFRGAQWLCSVNVPNLSCGTTVKIKEHVDKFQRAAGAMDSSLKNLINAVDKLSQTHVNTYKKRVNNGWQKFEEFGSCISNDALSMPKDPSHNKLCEALVHTGVTYVDIANSYGEQAKQDASPLIDHLILYRGILQQVPDLVGFDKNAIQINDETQQKPDKQNYNTGDMLNRLEVINYATLAEINFFNSQKVQDYNNYMRDFLSKQIEFYGEITDKLKKAYARFDAPQN